MNEWLKIMLEEIRRKRAEADERRREHDLREHENHDASARSGRRPSRGADRR